MEPSKEWDITWLFGLNSKSTLDSGHAVRYNSPSISNILKPGNAFVLFQANIGRYEWQPRKRRKAFGGTKHYGEIESVTVNGGLQLTLQKRKGHQQHGIYKEGTQNQMLRR